MTNASLSSAQGITIDLSTGAVFVAAFDGSLQKYDTDGNLIGTYGTSGAGKLTQAVGVAIDSRGNVYVGDYGARNVKKFDRSGNYLATLTGASGGFTFGAITGIAIDSSDNVYAADDDHSTIYVFNSAGTIVRHFTVGDPREPAGVVGIALDHSGNLWIAEFYRYGFAKYTTSGTLIAHYGTPGVPGIGDPLSPGAFVNAYGIGVDSNNNVYVADSGNNLVQEFDNNGNFKAFYGTGVAGSGPDQLRNPAGVAITNSGVVYVSDGGNNRINIFQPLQNY